MSETQRARGPDVCGDRTVERKVLALRARVLPGNSGGPLLDEDGQVLAVVFAAAADSADTGLRAHGGRGGCRRRGRAHRRRRHAVRLTWWAAA